MLNGLINITIQRGLGLLLTWGMEIHYLLRREDIPTSFWSFLVVSGKREW